MATNFEQLECFFNACDAFMTEKYMVADAKIAEILKAIAQSRALTDLFSAVTERFDYPTAKKAYLRFPAQKGSAHGAAYLPKDRGEILAFVFCILVDVDAGRIRFNDFLLRYFYEDGSYTASFALFSECMLRPFRDIVRECFPDVDARRSRLEEAKRARDERYGAISDGATRERVRLAAIPLATEDRDAGEAILLELASAADERIASRVRALTHAYRYFLAALSLEGDRELIANGEAAE